MNRDLGRRAFEVLGTSASVWFGQADLLLKCAKPVYDCSGQIPHSIWIVAMLRGYAVENMLKGWWIEQGHPLVRAGQLLQIPGTKPHDLAKMADVVAVPVSPEQRVMLDTLTAAVLHLGRYPIPTRVEHMPVHTPERTVPTAVWTPKHEGEFWNFVVSMWNRYGEVHKLPDGLVWQMRKTW